MFYIEMKTGPRSWRKLPKLFPTYTAAEAYAATFDPDGLLIGIRIKQR